MSPLLVILIYAATLGAAFLVLHRFHEKPWYLHAAAIVAAVWIGLQHMPEEWNRPTWEMWTGLLFAFLLFWGAAGPVFSLSDEEHHGKHA